MACGRGPRSSLRVLRHGLEVTEMAVSELPGNPNAVWTVKIRADGKMLFFISRDLKVVTFFVDTKKRFPHHSTTLGKQIQKNFELG